MSNSQTVTLDDIVTLVKEKIGLVRDPSMPYVGLEHIPSEGSRIAGAASAVAVD